MEKLNPHAGDTNTDSGHGFHNKANKPNGSKLNTSNEQNGSSGASSPHGNTAHGARVHPAANSSRAAVPDASASRTSISTETGKFLQPPNSSGKDSPHSVSSRSPGTQPNNANRFARPQMTSTAFVKAEPLPGQLDGQAGGHQSDIQPLMANETGEDARHTSSSASAGGGAIEQQRRGSTDDETDLHIDESESLSSLVSKSLRLTQRMGQFQAALETVNKELDKRKKGKSPMQPSHALPDSSVSHSDTDSPLESGR